MAVMAMAPFLRAKAQSRVETESEEIHQKKHQKSLEEIHQKT